MGKEAIMLSKTYKNHKSLILPAAIYEKLDGVPGDFYYRRELGQIHCRSRQNEELLSVDHIREFLTHKLPHGAHLVGELYIPGVPFKDISGLVRRKETTDETRKLCLYVFDYYIEGQEDMPYKARMTQFAEDIGSDLDPDDIVRMIRGYHVTTPEEFDATMARFNEVNPDAEGVVIRALVGDKTGFKAGWRSPGMLKLKTTNSVDLEVHSFEEAIDKDGNPKGMVGRINVIYHAGASSDGNNEYTDYEIIGAGPGKLSHAERTAIWENQKDYIGRIAEINYMPDPAYTALREPRFYRWRDDKTQPNQE